MLNTVATFKVIVKILTCALSSTTWTQNMRLEVNNGLD
jgi:hypothetical protein